MNSPRRIFDADRHVIEPLDLWRRFLPTACQAYAPYLEYRSAGTSLAARMVTADGVSLAPDLMVDGRPVMNLSDSARRALALAVGTGGRHADLAAAQSGAGQLATMDRDGITAAALLPTYGLFLVACDDMPATLAAAFAHAYNRWLWEVCGADRQRLHGVALLANHDVGAMLAELERIVAWGWRTVVLRPNPVGGRLLSDPAYTPFWHACEQSAIGVVLHEGTHARVPAAGADRFTTRFAMHACSHVMEQMMAFLALLEGGVLERHPRLRFALLEAASGWIPNWLWRLDELEYKHLAHEVADRIRQAPSKYFRRHCLAAFEPGEVLLEAVIDHLGDEHLVFGTDFPHLEHEQNSVAAVTRLAERMPAARMERLLWANAAAFFGGDARPRI